MGAAIAVLATLGIGAATVALGYSVFSNISPGKGRINKDLDQFRKDLVQLAQDLVPMEDGEIELLSSKPTIVATKKRVTQTWKGNFTSIYHENMVAFIFRKYVSKSKNALLLAKTANHEFIFRIKGDECEISVDNKILGTYRADDKLYLAKTGKPFAELNRKANQTMIPIIIGEREVAQLYKEGVLQHPNPRAFELIAKMPKEYQLTFIGLALFELVKRHSIL